MGRERGKAAAGFGLCQLPRKVRARQDTVVGNAHPSGTRPFGGLGKGEGKCHREHTADGRETGTGKGEKAG